MRTLLSNLIENLTNEIRKIRYKDCDFFNESESVKDNSIKCKCLSCNKTKLFKKLKERFNNTFKFSNNGINKFILLFRKDLYPYEYMDDWEKFNKSSLPQIEEFYSNLNIEDITDANYMHAKRGW